MIYGLQLDEAAEAALRVRFSSWSELFRQRLDTGGLPLLLAEYREMVDRLGAGKPRYYFDYLNDLSVRDALQILLPHVSAEAVRAELCELDERFKRTLTTGRFVLNPRVAERYPVDTHWWYYGLPRSVEGAPLD